jgi:hypothetical protein
MPRARRTRRWFLLSRLRSRVGCKLIRAEWILGVGANVVLILSLMFSSFHARAETGAVDCEAISANRNDKIVISQVKGINRNISEIQRQRVRNAINMQFPALDRELRDFIISVFCDERRPNQDSFDRNRSDLLNEFGVVVEVWGEVDQEGSLLYYAVVPLRAYEFFAKLNSNLTGFYAAEYGARVSESSPAELQSLFRDNRELVSFAALALGAKHLQRAIGSVGAPQKTRYFDNARSFFCAAAASLTDARQSGLRGLRENEWAALSSYAGDAARRTVERALADASYSGAMRLLPRQRLEQCS